MTAIGPQSQFRRSPPYATCIDRCRAVPHDAFTTPNSHRGARRACRAAAGRRRGGAGAALVARLPRQSVQPRRALAAGPIRSTGEPGAGGADRPRRISVRLDRMESALRQLTGTIEQLQYRNQQLEMQLKRMQDDTEYRFQQLGSKGGLPAGAAPRAMPPPGPVNAPPAAMPGSRSDVFDPAQHPNAPGAPRVLGNEAVVAAPEPNADNEAAGRRSGRPRRRRSARSLDARRRCAGAAECRRSPMQVRCRRRRLPPPRRATPAPPARSWRRCRRRPRRRTNTTWPTAMCCTRTTRWPSRPSAISCANIRTNSWCRTRNIGWARACSSASAIATRRKSFLAVSTKYETLRQGAGRAAAARPVAGRAQSEGSGLRHAGRSRTQISARLGEREARRRAGTKACALLRLRQSRQRKPKRFSPILAICPHWCWRFPAGRIRPR